MHQFEGLCKNPQFPIRQGARRLWTITWRSASPSGPTRRRSSEGWPRRRSGTATTWLGSPTRPGVAMDPWIAATILAEAVTDIPVAICVSNLVSRHPAASAAAIASLDLLCGGRAVLGIGAGHSGVRNLGLESSTAAEIERGVRFINELLRGGGISLAGTTAALPWVTQAPKVFVAASHDRALTAGGAAADGVYINYGLHRENVRDSEAVVRRSVEASGRNPDEIEIWQIAALDCSDDGESSRRHAICGTPGLMLSVSLATDPARPVELFGERVLPAVRSWG